MQVSNLYHFKELKSHEIVNDLTKMATCPWTGVSHIKLGGTFMSKKTLINVRKLHPKI